MPFVQRVVEPKNVSRTSLFDEDGKPKVSDGELEAVTNSTLSNALRQLASLVLAANDIFTELTRDLQKITERSHNLKTKIEKLDGEVAAYDPKKVAVPESDISTFALLKNHYARRQQVDSNLFSVTTRPNAVQALYEAASKTPVHVIRQMDRWRRDGTRSSRFFVCTPVLGQKRKKIKGKIDIEIETRMPAAVEELRRWTSSEALGDITVTPDCPNRIPQSVAYLSDGNVTDGTLVSDDEGIDHKLPSPEEQVQAIALKFPAEVVAVDISGRRFSRLSSQRRSVLYRSSGASATDTGAVDGASSSTATRRHTRSRRSRTRRRTTLAGTDEKEIKNALEAGEGPSSSSAAAPEEIVPYDIPPFLRSKSSDILRPSVRRSAATDNKKSHFQTLKEWGRNKFKLSSLSKSPTESQKNDDANKENENVDSNVYETITVRKRRSLNREKRLTHERNPSYSSSEKSSVSIPIAKPLSSAVALAVRLRDTSSSQRRFRKSCDNKDEPRSSSGNWSASSESGRASIASEITTHPKSTTSAATSNNSLNHPPNSSNSTRKFAASVSATDSVTSEGTLTPDIHDIHEDMDSSSVYSCDTEGYYTSFHMDSGLKTLKEEETPVMPFHTTSAFSKPGSPSDALSAESEYELFGKGSTSTTASSAGTVCTTLKAGDSDKSLFVGPSVPERKSSLSKSKDNVAESKEKNNTIKRSPASSKASVIAIVHKQSNGDISPDSGHNTSSSPTQSANSPNGCRSGSEFEYSECSDMEGTDRIERIRSKTAINSSRIPSMCVITPPQSDDESVKSFWEKGPPEYIDNMAYISLNDLNAKISSTTANISPDAPLTGYVTLESLEGIRKTNALPTTVPSQNTFRAPSPSGGSVTIKKEEESKPSSADSQTVQNQQPFIKASLLPLNVFGKLKLNIPNFSSKVDKNDSKTDNNSNEYDEYVTIADIRNNNGKMSKRLPPTSSEVYSDTVSKKLNDVLTNRIRETEYVSLDELPSNPSQEKSQDSNTSSLEKKRQGARVTLDADGKVVYSSDSLKRKKNAHTTFQPGPFVKSPSETPEQSPLINRRTTPIRPVQQQGNTRPMSPPQYIIRAQSGIASPTAPTEVIRVPSSTIFAPPSAGPTSTKPVHNKGAYVHMQKQPSESLTTKGQALFTNIPTSPASHQDLRMWTLPQRNSTNLYNPWPANTDSPATQNYCDYCRFQTFPHRKPDHYRTVPRMPGIYVYSINPVPYEGQFVRAVPNARNITGQNPNESLKISPIEPCKPQHMFQSSTPRPPVQQLKHAVNLESKLLSPKKSTMTNEELYAVIHKSKKKLNILTDKEPAQEPMIPKEVPAKLVKSPETGYLKNRSRGRISWSPMEDKLDSRPDLGSSPGSRQSWAHSDKKAQIKQTSQMDFKRLLLQQSAKSNITSNNSRKLSAVEQLKLSKQQAPIQTKSPMNILDLSSSPRSLQRKLFHTPPRPGGSDKPRPPAKLISPRSPWRFASPRTDVLSSTILEDCREDESSGGSSLEKKSLKNNSGEYSPQNDNNNVSPKLSVSQYIKAKRAQFFSSTPKSNAENTSRFGRNISNNSSSPKKYPALETSV